MTIFELLKRATEQLKATEDPRSVVPPSAMLDAELLLAHTLGVSRSWLFAHLNEEVHEATQTPFLAYVERRKLHEPIAYIMGKQPFYGRSFAVDTHTLIPRPTTEDLVTLILEAHKKAPPAIASRTRFIEVGTGSGCIAITIALALLTPVLAIDIDARALQVASKNAAHLGASSWVTFQQSFLLAPLFSSEHILSHDPLAPVCIIANLPYVPGETFHKVMPDVRLHEPLHALVSGFDGLNLIWHLLWQLHLLQDQLPPQVDVFLEHDLRQEKTIQRMVSRLFPHMHMKTRQDTRAGACLTHLFTK